MTTRDELIAHMNAVLPSEAPDFWKVFHETGCDFEGFVDVLLDTVPREQLAAMTFDDMARVGIALLRATIQAYIYQLTDAAHE